MTSRPPPSTPPPTAPQTSTLPLAPPLTTVVLRPLPAARSWAALLPAGVWRLVRRRARLLEALLPAVWLRAVWLRAVWLRAVWLRAVWLREALWSVSLGFGLVVRVLSTCRVLIRWLTTFR
ncbi:MULTISPECIES: hypothetical protein [unclassified Saccharothrix]|uniref:hypothetical protein n=1 Tax=unclassified Saccharothrix TaxID=2593673 RepID=UPI00307DED4C